MLFGRRQPPTPTTIGPEPLSQWESIARGQRTARNGLSGWWRTMRGTQPEAVRVCAQGHLVTDGNTTCPYGHWAA